MTKFQEKLIAEGYCDDRGAVFYATATKLPNGEFGMVALCVKGNTLSVYDADMKGLREKLYTVELKNIKNLKIRTGLLSQVLKFEYDGGLFSFTNFSGIKPILKIIEEESNKQPK